VIEKTRSRPGTANNEDRRSHGCGDQRVTRSAKLANEFELIQSRKASVSLFASEAWTGGIKAGALNMLD
jgi:hypothetical protein